MSISKFTGLNSCCNRMFCHRKQGRNIKVMLMSSTLNVFMLVNLYKTQMMQVIVFPEQDRCCSTHCSRGRLLPFRRGRQAPASRDCGGGPDTIDRVSFVSEQNRRLTPICHRVVRVYESVCCLCVLVCEAEGQFVGTHVQKTRKQTRRPRLVDRTEKRPRLCTGAELLLKRFIISTLERSVSFYMATALCVTTQKANVHTHFTLMLFAKDA